MRILVRQLDDMFSTLHIPGRIGINHFRLFDLSPNNIELRLQNWLDCSTIKKKKILNFSRPFLVEMIYNGLTLVSKTQTENGKRTDSLR